MPISSSSIALVFLSLTALLVLLPRRLVHGESWTLLRCLFPAWRFFEDIAPAPRLRYRVGRDGTTFGAWIDALPVPPRGAAALFHDPEGNLFLACQSLVERLVADLEDCDEAQARALVSYRLVQRLVRARILAADGGNAAEVYQFGLEPHDFLSGVHARCE
jgi:hypothetical protein